MTCTCRPLVANSRRSYMGGGGVVDLRCAPSVGNDENHTNEQHYLCIHLTISARAVNMKTHLFCLLPPCSIS
jgi:hypothetical protein